MRGAGQGMGREESQGRGGRVPRWLPARERTAIEEFGVQGRPLRFLVGVALTLGVLAIPPVAKATGIQLKEVCVVFGVNVAWVNFADRFLYRRALASAVAFYALVFGTVVQGAFICLSLPVLAHQPSTPLWVAFVLMACIVGASETEASLVLGLFHPLAPFLTIPVFVAQGHPLQRAVVGPLVAAFASGYGYWFLARRREHWRRDRHEREMALAAARLAESENERQRLSRDLHDSVGTTLSLLALYGTLAEAQSGDAAEARRLAGTIRDAARGALHELRGVLQALPQSPTTLDDLASGLALVARRAAEPAGAVLSVEVGSGGAEIVGGSLRTTIVRVFQEAVHNAIHHGRARGIRARLAAAAGRIELEITDDGQGFDPSSPVAGTGIAGMRDRARELGGEVIVESVEGQGARVRLELPFKAEQAA
jgi:signal transduction histidine kinase